MNSSFSRRQLLSRASAGFGMAALAGLMQEQALAEMPFVHRAKKFAPKARSVIFLYMSGGVSHVDTFDPKPLLEKHAGKPMPGVVQRTQFNNNGNCVDCHASCLTCNGSTANDCTNCHSQLLQRGQCVDVCSAGFYQSGSKCSSCPAACGTCADGVLCTACANATRFLQAGGCVDACAPGMVTTWSPARLCTPYVPCGAGQFNDSSGVCTACDASCATCHGPLPSDCGSCHQQQALNLMQNGTCVGQCASNWYRTLDLTCLPCPSDCATCTLSVTSGGSGDPAACATCAMPGDVIDHGRCLAACSPGNDADATGVCQPSELTSGATSYSPAQIAVAAAAPIAVLVITIVVYYICHRVEP